MTKIDLFHRHGDGSDNDAPGSGLGGNFPQHPQTPGSHAQTLEFRSIDGSGDNQTNTTLNATGTDFTRIGPAHFAGNDGHTPIDNGINPRTISNVVVGQGDAEVTNAQGLSDWMYAWGQFVDHDLDLIKSGTTAYN